MTTRQTEKYKHVPSSAYPHSVDGTFPAGTALVKCEKGCLTVHKFMNRTYIEVIAVKELPY